MLKVLRVAQSWLGANEVDGSYKEIIDTYNNYFPAHGLKYPRGVKMEYYWEWCSCFVSACYIRAYEPRLVPDKFMLEIGVWEVYNFYKMQGRVKNPRTCIPKPGDTVIFDWTGRGTNYDHIGFVEYVEGDTLHTIEGNAGGQRVVRKTYSLSEPQIYAYLDNTGLEEDDPTPQPSKDGKLIADVVSGGSYTWSTGAGPLTRKASCVTVKPGFKARTIVMTSAKEPLLGFTYLRDAGLQHCLLSGSVGARNGIAIGNGAGFFNPDTETLTIPAQIAGMKYHVEIYS